METLTNYYIEELIRQQEKIIKLSFRKMFDANMEILMKFAPEDFSCRMTSGMKRYYWCGVQFLVIGKPCTQRTEKGKYIMTFDYYLP